MPDISGILNMGRQALSAHQRAIAVTSNNISNVNTPGYSRQKPIYETAPPLNGVFGTGVQIAQVRSVVDTFLQRQIISGQSTLGRFGVEKGLMDRVEGIFNDTSADGIDTAISDFFAAVNDLSSNPSGTAERIVLLERGRSLSQTIRSADAQLKSISRDVDTEIRGRVDEVNVLAEKIADLNKQIQSVENLGNRNTANDLRDDRVRLLEALSEKIEVHLLEGQGGELTVTVGSGGRTVALVSGENAYSLSTHSDTNNSGLAKILSGDTDITRSITDGRLRGLIELRDNLLPAYADRLDKLTASIVTSFNTRHEKGFALDGSAGGDFFLSLNVILSEPSTNSGGAEVLPVISDASALTFDSYEISFSQDQFTMRNVKTGASTNEFTETDFGFTATFEGISIEIAGDAAEGDKFNIDIPYQGQAGKMDMALSDPALVAAAGSAEELPGGNGNAVLLAQLQDQSFFALNATFQGFYANFTGEVGARANTSQRNLSVEEVISGKLDTLRQEVSGVSLDEEMTNLISFQRAYQAAAKLVTTADELLQTVIEMKR